MENVRSGARAVPLARQLKVLVLLVAIPSLAVSVFLTAVVWNLLWEKTNEATALLARDLSATLDKELARIESGLEVLAASDELAQGDLEGLRRRALAAVKTQIVYNYILTDPQGRQLMNTLVPWGRPLPTQGTPAALATVFTEGRPVLSDYFIGPVTGKPALALGVPVTREGKVVASLNVGLTPEAVARVLTRRALPDQWVASVLDRRGTIIARTVDQEKYSGVPAVDTMVRAIAASDEGTLQTKTIDGRPAVSSFVRVGDGPWTVAVGAPLSAVWGPMAQVALPVLGGLIAVLVLALFLSARLLGRVTASLRDLNRMAEALGADGPLPQPRTLFQELDAVVRGLESAHAFFTREHHRATHDLLTGLPNRSLFQELAERHVSRAHRENGSLAILALDLDGFKGVNDTFGHAVGDEALKVVADRIRSCLRASDPAARIGGDEFSILLDGVDRASALLVAGRLAAALSEPYPVLGDALSGSVGVALFPESGRTLKDLSEGADRALYRAKAAGKRCVAVEP